MRLFPPDVNAFSLKPAVFHSEISPVFLPITVFVIERQQWIILHPQICFGVVRRASTQHWGAKHRTRKKKTKKKTQRRELARAGGEGRGGGQTGCIMVRLWCVFTGAVLTTPGRVFPRCSAEQSGHLVLTDTNTHTQTQTRRDTDTLGRGHAEHAACSCCQ